MAYVNSTRVAQISVLDRIANLFTAASAVMERRRVYGQTVRELRALSDRDLADLGISASMIPSIAHEAAYGK